METPLVSISLEDELQALRKALSSGSKFTCYGKSLKGARCGNPLSKSTRKKIDLLTRHITELLKNESREIEKMLEELSILVMCVRYHQNQALDKCKAWVKKILDPTFTELSDGFGKPNVNSSALKKPLTDFGQERGSSFSTANEDVSEMVAPLERLSNNSDLQSTDFSHFISYHKPSNAEDLGYESDYDRVRNDNQNAVLVTETTGEASMSKRIKPPETPKRPPPMPTTDSSYMSFERPTKVVIKTEECPPSPSAARGARKKPQQISKNSKSEVLPVHLKSSPVSESIGCIPPAPKIRPPSSSSSLTRWSDANKGMKKFIRAALGHKSLKDGYIYAFVIPGCSSYKIGYAARRKNEKSLEDSLNKRIKEHTKCGWDAKKVLNYYVPHAHKVEKIIHIHLEADRQIEHNFCKEIKGKACKHKKHIEWFDTPYERIHVVVQAWKRWIELKPYVNIKGKMCLKPEWHKSLDAVPNDKSGDNWLQWLDWCAPASAMLTCRIELKEVHDARITGPAKNSNSADGIDSTNAVDDDGSGGQVIASNTRAPRTRLEFKLSSSRTWPRRTKAANE